MTLNNHQEAVHFSAMELTSMYYLYISRVLPSHDMYEYLIDQTVEDHPSLASGWSAPPLYVPLYQPKIQAVPCRCIKIIT